MALSWCFEDEASDHSTSVLRALVRARAAVPSLWFYEVTNGLVTGVRRGRLTLDGIGRFVDALDGLPIDVATSPTPSAPNFRELHQLATEEKLSSYDAAYLQLAIERGLPLATLDGEGRRQGLKQAAVRRGVGLYSAPRGASDRPT